VLERVADEVGKNLRQPVSVESRPGIAAAAHRDARRRVSAFELVAYRAAHVGDAAGMHRERHAARADARNVEELLDHLRHAPRAAADALGDAFHFLVRRDLQQDFGAHRDRVQRVAQVVAEHRRKRLVQTQRALQLRELGLHAPLLRIELDEHADLALKDHRVYRLVQEIDRARFVAAESAQRIVRRRGHENNRDVARALGAAHELGKLEAVHAGHAHVHERERDVMHEQELQRFVAGARGEELEAGPREHRFDRGEVLGHVVDDEYLDRFVHHSKARAGVASAAS
jgi:hypothetical protein